MIARLVGAAALVLLSTGAAQAQGYDSGPRPAYAAAGGYYGGDGDCRFTLAGAHAGVTVLGINLGAGARLSLPIGCGYDAAQVAYAAPQPYAPPQPYYPPQGYAPAYGYQGGYPGGYPASYQGGYAPPVVYAQPAAYPQPAAYGYAAAPCGCQPMGYRPY